MRTARIGLMSLAIATVCGAGTAEALTTPTGEYRVKRTAFSRSGTSKEDVPSGRSEIWTLDKGCKPGKQCLFRVFGRSRLAPPVYGLNLTRNAFTKTFKHSFDHDCYLYEDMTSTFRLHVTKTKGSRAVRFTASLTWAWKKDVRPPDPEPEPQPTPEPEDPSDLAAAAAVERGSARATYIGTYSGPAKDSSEQAPVQPWEDICLSA